MVETFDQEMKRSTVAVFGSTGNLGSALKEVLSSSSYSYHFPSRGDVDVTNWLELNSYLKWLQPARVVNAAAWTRVDAAESQEAACRKLNVETPKYLADLSVTLGFTVIHVSTDYVFDGLKKSPYLEDDTKNPISIYGKTKSDGEEFVFALEGLKGVVVRTSGLYGFTENNFVMKLSRMARRGEVARVVDDQITSPTNALDLAKFIRVLVEGDVEQNLIHFSNSGEGSWFDVASHIYREMGREESLVKAIKTDQLRLLARRPFYSKLESSTGLLTEELSRDWRIAISDFLNDPRVYATF